MQALQAAQDSEAGGMYIDEAAETSECLRFPSANGHPQSPDAALRGRHLAASSHHASLGGNDDNDDDDDGDDDFADEEDSRFADAEEDTGELAFCCPVGYVIRLDAAVCCSLSLYSVVLHFDAL